MASKNPKRKNDSPEETKGKLERLEAGNRQCAHIILENPQRYGGLMLEWAHRILKATNHPPTENKWWLPFEDEPPAALSMNPLEAEDILAKKWKTPVYRKGTRL